MNSTLKSIARSKILKNPFKRLDFISVLSYLVILVVFMLFNRIENQVLPYSVAVFTAVIVQGGSLIVTPLIFLLSFVIQGAFGLLGSASICAVTLSIIIAIYRKYSHYPKYEILCFLSLSLLGFILLGSTTEQIPLLKRVLTAFLCVALCFFTMTAGKAVKEKGLRFKLGFEEFLSLSICVGVLGVGVCNLFSPIVWKGVSTLILLLTCYLYRTGIATLTSSVLGLSLALFFGDISYIAVYLLWALAAESLMPLSRFVSAVGIIVCDYLIQIIFSVYGGYGVIDFIAVTLGATAFCAIPLSPLKKLKEKLYSFREKQLVRSSINRNRVMLAGRLYDLSAVFTEIAGAFNLFNSNAPDDDKIKSTMNKQILSACKECEYFERCSSSQKEFGVGVSKMLDIGFAKGKLSLIDMPREVSGKCLKPQSLLYSINKLLADYRNFVLERTNVENGRNLLAAEALGVAEILRALALESGATLKFQSRLERALSDALFKNGVLISELLIYGEEDRLSVGIIVVMKEFSIDHITAVISKTLGKEMTLVERAEVTENKCYLSFMIASPFDAVFGIARAVKDGSEKSGDTHSVTRISGGKFLVALSDGMGSGKNAEIVSSASLSLIESFYKAGLKSQLILSTVNKLLAINTEDTFAALDTVIVDLNACSADFIKYGAPYGFIVGNNGVKIVEGSSLPLGIIEELKPSVCSAPLCDGDVVVLFTDGVSDAFSSSSSIVDYLRSVPAKNPQTLADGILERAIALSGGRKDDDMTVLAVRIYKRVS